jgi:hypothetical protein
MYCKTNICQWPIMTRIMFKNISLSNKNMIKIFITILIRAKKSSIFHCMEVKNRYSIKINGKQKKILFKIFSLEKELIKITPPRRGIEPRSPA